MPEPTAAEKALARAALQDRPPRVSVCILSHRRQFLAHALRSVWCQTYTDYEIVLKYALPYWPDKLQSLVSGARGEFFVILADDDELDPTFLERHVAAADETRADIVYSDVTVIGEYAKDPKFQGHRVKIQLPAFDAEILKLHCVPYLTALTRRSLWEKVGGYDGAQPYIDWDFWIRCYQAGARAHHLKNEFLFWPRSHGANGSKLMDNDDALRLLRAKHSALAPAIVQP